MAVACLAATPVLAATYYVRPTGSDTNGGLSPAGAWATIGKANNTLVAGDVAVVYPGTYAQFPDPVNSGTSYSNRITFVGDLANPASTVVPGGTVTDRYVTLKGFRFSGGVSFASTARYDSVAYSSMGGDMWWFGNKYCMVYRCTITGSRFSAQTSNGVTVEADTLQECTLSLGAGVTSQPHAVDLKSRVQYCVFRRNRIFITMPSGASDVHARMQYHMDHNLFEDNYWQVVNNAGGPMYAFNMRDSSSFNRFVRDTIIATGNATLRIAMSTSGGFANSVRANVYDGCFFKVTTSGTDYALWYQNGMRRDTLVRCVVATNGSALVLPDATGPILIDHCTFYGNPGGSFNGGVANFDPQAGATWGGVIAITNNIFYGGTSKASDAYGVMHSEAAIGQGSTSVLSQNYNLFACYAQSSTPGDHSIGLHTFAGGTNGYRVGSGSTWCSTGYRQDCNSRYASPLFQDSTLLDFDPRLLPNSPARGMGQGGSDVGALSYATGVDTIAPAAVTDMDTALVSDENVILRWTAPGDDGLVGVATTYDLRYSPAPIVDASFASATRVTVQPVPAPAGTVQTYVMLGLTPDTDYYFALKTADESGNTSSLSNVLRVHTFPSDTRPPAAVQDLTSGF